ncbi:nuclear transport factor 2 family protein [Streptomyces coerulescens]|uniref:Nuclear transport factor 2 family protein n=1 Tax=Streptomyces coerulescens TaxID=29304 RepID=A0ABW0CXX7_STRCD
MTGTRTGAAAADRDKMVRDMCAAVDAHEFERFGSYFTDTAYYRFGNSAPVHGRAAIVAATAGAVASIPPVRHHIDQIAQFGDQLFCRFTIEVALEDGTVAMPCVTVIGLAPDSGAGAPKIIDYRVHMDISPALAPPPV